MKTISIFLALVNSLLAGLLIAASLAPAEFRQGEFWWLATKMVAASAVIVIGLITWLGSLRSPNPSLVALSSLFLVALGAATVVWTFHLAMVTGDMEYYMVVYGGSLAVQGLASLFGFGPASQSVAI